jgi:hypothetical protein
MLDFQSNLALLVAIAAIFGGLLSPVLGLDFASGTSGGEEDATSGECDPSYPEDCIPSPPPDLDCGDTNVPNNVRVVEPDPHRLDSDNNGIGCESSNSGGGSDGGSSLVEGVTIAIEVPLPINV